MPRIASLFIFNSVLIFIFLALFGFRINISESYPLGIYKRVEGEYVKNSLVESCLPDDVAVYMVSRSYIPSSGNCGGYPAVIKSIYAVAGDSVEVNERVSVNGQIIPGTEVLAFDSDMRPLQSASNTTIPNNYVWLMSNNIPNSFDARYFGETSTDLIVTNLRPIWTRK